jgi:hypothetical protein
VSHGYRIRESDPRRQLVEVVLRLDLFRSIVPFRRCLCCNDLLETVREYVLVCIAVAMFVGWSIVAIGVVRGSDEPEQQVADQGSGARAAQNSPPWSARRVKLRALSSGCWLRSPSCSPP